MSATHLSNTALGVLLLLGFLVLMLIKPVEQAWDDATTPQPWFAVAISTPDHVANANPFVRYDRFPQRVVTGDWFVTVSRLAEDGAQFVCNGTGSANYSPYRENRLNMRLDTFIGNENCDWQGGLYEMCAEYILSDPSRDVTRSFGPICDQFMVIAAE